MRAGGRAALFVVSDVARMRAYVNVPAELRAEHQARHQGTDHGAGVSRPDVSSRRSKASAQAVDCGLRHDRACCLQVDNSKGRADDRRLSPMCGSSCLIPEAAIHVPGERADFRPEGSACRNRRRRRPARAQAGDDSRAISGARSRSAPVLRSRIGSSKARRTASRRATRCASPASRARRPRTPKGRGSCSYCEPSSPSFFTSAPHFSCSALR
jgi:hypothetical protein